MKSLLLIGHSAIHDGVGIVVLGGGATCFSFGAYLNTGSLRSRAGYLHSEPWDMVIETEVAHEGPQAKRPKLATTSGLAKTLKMGHSLGHVLRQTLSGPASFERLVRKTDANPIVICNHNVGSCVDKCLLCPICSMLDMLTEYCPRDHPVSSAECWARETSMHTSSDWRTNGFLT